MASIEELRRRLLTDPEDREALLAMAAARARLHGSEELLGPLRDRAAWAAASEPLQDLVIEEVARRFDKEVWSLDGVRVWRCKAVAHRLASLRHRASGIVFNLIPGDQGAGLSPFLIGRWGLTDGQWNRLRGLEPRRSFHYRPDRAVALADARDVEIRLGGFGFRLPTGEEWLHACWAGAATRFPFGDDFDPAYVWFADPRQANGWDLFGASGFSPGFREHDDAEIWNGFGLVDMIGDLAERVQVDDFRDYTLGGSCLLSQQTIEEHWDRPSLAGQENPATIGFRLALDIPPP